MTKNKKIKMGMDRWFLVISGILIALLVLIAVLSIIFLAGRMLKGFSSPANDSGELEFNFEGYEKLNL